MSQALLRWQEGTGWLVFSAGASEGSVIRAAALTRALADGDVVYISLAEDGGDALLDDMEDLGAPTGYMVDVRYEDNESILEQIQDASLVVLETGTSLDVFYRAMQGAPLEAIRRAYEHGAVILVEGPGINLFGRWLISDEGHVLSGVDWVRDAFIEADSDGATSSRAVQAIMATYPEAIAINIGMGSAIAFGAEGQVELWGERQVTLSLGRQYADEREL